MKSIAKSALFSGIKIFGKSRIFRTAAKPDVLPYYRLRTSVSGDKVSASV
jgi:hypothetical protein